jgi:hypothetical protein
MTDVVFISKPNRRPFLMFLVFHSYLVHPYLSRVFSGSGSLSQDGRHSGMVPRKCRLYTKTIPPAILKIGDCNRTVSFGTNIHFIIPVFLITSF